jgi:hypothetical protein
MLKCLFLNSMKRFYPLAIILCCTVQLCTLASCNNFLCPPPNEEKVLSIEQNPLFPLKVGNYWRYAFVRYYPLSNEYDTLSSYRSEVVSDTIIRYMQNQYKCVVLSDDVHYFHYTTASEVFRFQTFDIPDTILRNVTLRYPVRLNDTIIAVNGTLIASRTNPMIEREISYAVCISINQEIETLAGKFKCFVFRYTNSQIPNRVAYGYYAFGIGNVGQIINSIDPRDPQRKEQLLQKYLLAEYKIQ